MLPHLTILSETLIENPLFSIVDQAPAAQQQGQVGIAFGRREREDMMASSIRYNGQQFQ